MRTRITASAAIPLLALGLFASAGVAHAAPAAATAPAPSAAAPAPAADAVLQDVDQSLPQYLPGERRKDMSKADFDKVWAQRPQPKKTKATGAVTPSLTDNSTTDYDLQQADAASTTTRTARSKTQSCPDASNWGTNYTQSLAVAWDDIVIHNSSGYHYYVQPHSGLNWALFRSNIPASVGDRYLMEMTYYGYDSGRFYTTQDPGRAPNNANASLNRSMNNAQNVANVHNGIIGTGTTWWYDIDITRADRHPSLFRGIVTVASGPEIQFYFNRFNQDGIMTGCVLEMFRQV